MGFIDKPWLALNKQENAFFPNNLKSDNKVAFTLYKIQEGVNHFKDEVHFNHVNMNTKNIFE